MPDPKPYSKPKQMGNDGTVYKCPLCKKVLPHINVPTFPFCSDRCRLTDLNNQFHPGMLLSLSMGAATSAFGERLEEVVRRADIAMYEAKRDFYSDLASNDRRSEPASARAVAT